MFHSQQVFCEATQCSLQIKAPQLSWLWIIAFFINVTNSFIIFGLKKKWKQINEFSLVHLAETQKHSPDQLNYRLYRHQTISFLQPLPSWGHCLHSLLWSWKPQHHWWFTVLSPVMCGRTGSLSSGKWNSFLPSFQSTSLLVSQHSRGKSNRPHLR